MTMTEELDARARAYAKKMCDKYGDEEEIYSFYYNKYVEIADEQRKVDEADYTEQMRQLNEEWMENLAIQRQMLIDKACGLFTEVISPFKGSAEYIREEDVNEWIENFQKDMEK